MSPRMWPALLGDEAEELAPLGGIELLRSV